jgi:molybdopterin molybdotransferase
MIRPGIKLGANVRKAGEDIQAGPVVLEQGRRLRPQDIGLAASIGRNALAVFKRLRVAIFSTGDELYDAGEGLPPGGIYDSNRYIIQALLNDLGCTVEDLGILEDRLDTIRDALAAAADQHDLIITSGGMSVGEEDHVKASVEALGSLHFWKLAIKPGRPLGFGQIRGVPFIGLPGNPVAVMVTFMRIARPAILRLGGCKDPSPSIFKVPIDFSYKKKAGRREWVRARLVANDAGGLVASKYPREGSGILSSMVRADGLVEFSEDLTFLEAGTVVDFLPFSELSR